MNTSVTTWIGLLKTGQEAAAQKLWERYFPRLVELARAKLRGLSRREADEEDVALSVFHTFFRASTNGRIPQLSNREDLWRSLVLITSAKAIDQRRHQSAQKRGGKAESPDGLAVLEALVGNEPDPAFAALVAEECQLLLSRLDDDEMRQIALWKLEGHTNEEIAELLSCSVRTIKRRVALIRRILEEGAATPSEETGDHDD